MDSHNYPSFIPRKTEYDQLVDGLLDQRFFGPVAVTSGLGAHNDRSGCEGGRGFGKTALVRAVVEDPRLRESFTGGIVWTRLGRSLSPLELLSRIERLAFDLTGAHPMLVDLSQAYRMLDELLQDRHALLVVDDADDAHALKPFVRACPEGGLLIITHDDTVLPEGITRVPVDVMHTEEAIALLSSGLMAEGPGGDRWTRGPLFKALTDLLNDWPLPLALVNGLLRGWLDDHPGAGAGEAAVKAGSPLLSRLEAGGLAGSWRIDHPAEQQEALRCVLLACLEPLSPEERERYRELCIFPRGEPIPCDAAAQLWQKAGLGRAASLSLIERLARRRLLDRSPDSDTQPEGGVFWLPQGIHLVLEKELGEERLVALHGRMVDGYFEKPITGAFAYFFRYLPMHLTKAKRTAMLNTLLFDFEWIAASLDSTRDLPHLLIDYEAALSTSLDLQSGELRLVQETLRLAGPVLAQFPEQIPVKLAEQIAGRLYAFEEPELKNLLERALSLSGQAWLRPLSTCFTPPGNHELRILRGHQDWVTGLALLPDGQHAFSGSLDGTLRRWDLANGQNLSVWKPGEQEELAAASSSEEEWLDARVTSISGPDTFSGVPVTGFAALNADAGINTLAVTQDGCWAVTGSWDGSIRVWDAGTGQEKIFFRAHREPVAALVLTPNGNAILSSSDAPVIHCWNRETGALLHTYGEKEGERHDGPVHTLDITPDGRTLVSGSWDGTLKLWDMETGGLLHTLRGHEGWVRKVKLTPDGYSAVSSGWDSTLRVWDLWTGDVRHVIHTETPVYSIAITPDSRQSLTGDGMGNLRLWDLNSGKEVLALEGHSGGINALSITASGRFAVSASDDRTVRTWDLAAARNRNVTTSGHSAQVSALASLPDGEAAAAHGALSGSSDGTLKLWDVTDGRLLQTLEGHADEVLALAISANGQYAVSGGRDRSLRLWDLRSGSLVHVLNHHRGAVTAVAIAPDARVAASGDDQGMLKAWDALTGEMVAEFNGEGAIQSLVLSPDGSVVTASAADGRMYFLEIRR